MHLTELKTFLAIIDAGSLVRAAEALNVTQSTVTARLKSLELEMGQILIDRKKSGATATAAGLRLQRYANTISDLWRQAKQETALSERLQSVCNIAVQTDLWLGLGKRVFDYMHTEFPEVGLSVWQGSQKEISAWMKDGLTDIALTYAPNVSPSYSSARIADDQLILVATDTSHPVRFDPTYVYVEAGEEFGQQHAAAYADASIARINFGTALLGLEHILDVGGSAYLPKRIVDRYLSCGELVELSSAPKFSRPIHLIAKKSTSSSWDWVNSEDTINKVLVS